MRIWSTEQAVAFLNGAAGHRLYPAVYLMMATGLRRGEVSVSTGVTWLTGACTFSVPLASSARS